MKRLIIALFAMLSVLLIFVNVSAADAPKSPRLTFVSFENADVNEVFSPDRHDYTLTLDDSSVTPTLKNYNVDGDADVFVSYLTDAANHQTGMSLTLEFENGTRIYNFMYANAPDYPENNNSRLRALNCRFGEVYPEISDGFSTYRLYIPSDMTVLKLTAVTQDIGAYCDLPKEISLGVDQEPELTTTVTASDGSTSTYVFKVKRLSKNTKEVEQLINSPDFETLAADEQIYNKPIARAVFFSLTGGVIFIIILIAIIKRLNVKAEDGDEVEFFDAA